MADGNPLDLSPIISALLLAEGRTTRKIQVRFSKRIFELSPRAYARKIYQQTDGILIYLNLRKKHFVLIADQDTSSHLPPMLWKEWASFLRAELSSTHYEKAVIRLIERIGEKLGSYFPRT